MHHWIAATSRSSNSTTGGGVLDHVEVKFYCNIGFT